MWLYFIGHKPYLQGTIIKSIETMEILSNKGMELYQNNGA